MGWAYGVVGDREVGYSVDATCDHPDCNAEINRGLSYFCGNLPGDDLGCGGFFCQEHLHIGPRSRDDFETPRQVCGACSKEWAKILEDDDKEG